jgi:hypothetical protein
MTSSTLSLHYVAEHISKICIENSNRKSSIIALRERHRVTLIKVISRETKKDFQRMLVSFEHFGLLVRTPV